jgi:hypothetical protein
MLAVASHSIAAQRIDLIPHHEFFQSECATVRGRFGARNRNHLLAHKSLCGLRTKLRFNIDGLEKKQRAFTRPLPPF